MSENQFILNLVEGSVRFQFTPNAARELKEAIDQLMQTFKAAATKAAKTPGRGARPTPQKTMEYRYAGDIFLEIFCNPNIYPTPFAAKVLVTVRDDRIRITSEAQLTQLVEDINVYLDKVGE
ncbi:MAG: hypothetical protein F6J93_25225 [Oscillatoria sp. SIO1A7]|nr:hypothetical protein [Oscillatoria sp. SIO1A7]